MNRKFYRYSLVIILIAFINAQTENSMSSEYKNKDFIGKWTMSGYIYDAKPMPLKKENKNDFIDLSPNNTFSEIKSGKFDKGYWEYLPVGHMIMFYDPWKEGYQPMKVVKVNDLELQLLITWQGGSSIIVFTKEQNN
jgi:hypothetical protein